MSIGSVTVNIIHSEAINMLINVSNYSCITLASLVLDNKINKQVFLFSNFSVNEKDLIFAFEQRKNTDKFL